MRFLNTRLYSFSAPLLLLPLMKMQFDNIGDYIRNLEPEFRQIIAEIVIARLSMVVESLLLAFTRLFGGA